MSEYQTGISVKFGEEVFKAYKLDENYESHYLRAMSTIRISQRLKGDGATHSIDTDIDCRELEKNNHKVYESGYIELEKDKYLLLKIA